MTSTSHESTPRGALRHRDTRGLRVGTVLLLVAIIPLVGVVSVLWNTIANARTVVVGASRTEDLSQQAVALAELDAAVFDEMVWTAMASVTASLGTPAGLMGTFIGTDPDAQLEAVSARSDELAEQAGRPDVIAGLAAVRAADLDLGGVLTEYAHITMSIETPLAQLLRDVTTSATGSAGAEGLADKVRVLEQAVEMRAVIAEEFYAYFASIFEVRGTPADELTGLLQLRARHDAVLASLAEIGAGTPDFDAALRTLDTDPAVADFRLSVDELITRSLGDGVPGTGAPLTLANLLPNIDGFTTAFVAMNTSSDATLTVLDHAVDGVLTASDQVRAEADRHIRRSYGIALALMVTSLVTALLAARFIVRPLSGLRKAAEHLQTNQELVAPELVGGPAEVKAAAQAIQDAAAHFDLVTRQARSLAAGVLDADVLDEEAPGGLGTALQSAVGTLRTALAQQDEFRRRLAHEATHDGLTKLANRNASMTQLSRSLARTTRSGGQLAVLFIDLDRFKDVNDLHGHQAGDAVLAVASQRLVNSVREGDHVGRLGGDEFVVIAEPVSGIDETVALGTTDPRQARRTDRSVDRTRRRQHRHRHRHRREHRHRIRGRGRPDGRRAAPRRGPGRVPGQGNRPRWHRDLRRRPPQRARRDRGSHDGDPPRDRARRTRRPLPADRQHAHRAAPRPRGTGALAASG